MRPEAYAVAVAPKRRAFRIGIYERDNLREEAVQAHVVGERTLEFGSLLVERLFVALDNGCQNSVEFILCALRVKVNLRETL